MQNIEDDIFFDCLSESESDSESIDMVNENILESGYGDADVNANCQVVIKPSPNVDDPIYRRSVLERASNVTQMLLRSVGGQSAPGTCCGRCYPVTLEISAKIYTDEAISRSMSLPWRLRGDEVTVKLPILLNPFSGQLQTDIFQPKPKPLPQNESTGIGGGDKLGAPPSPSGFSGPPSSSPSRRHSQRHDNVNKKTARRVRWTDEDYV